MKPIRFLETTLRMAADPDVRGYARYAARRPRLWRLRRPSSSATRPEYLRTGSGGPIQFTPPKPLEWGTSPLERADADLRLASTTLKAARFESLPWHMHFHDIEDEASLHRFAWLLPWMLERRREGSSAGSVWGGLVTAVRDWIAQHPEPVEGEAFDSYTISERMVNWIVAALALGDFPLPIDLTASIVMQAEHLSNHLEYYGERLTGNHLSNNGRALYFAGLVVGRADLAHHGKTILLEERKRLFDERGFLREGSTHYQFLMARNYEEALWMAEASGDSALGTELAATVRKLKGACAFFVVPGADGWRIPLMGDVSPDCPPQWLIGVATDARNGWRELFPQISPAGVAPSSSEEWGRIDGDGWTVFAHVNRSGMPMVPGHAHHDTGGIAAFYRGSPVILDCGRKHYVDDAAGRFGVSGLSHSLLMIDGLNPEPRDRWFLSREFLELRSGGKPELLVGDGGLRIIHRGYQRAPGVGQCVREVVVRGGELSVSDAVEGEGVHRLMLVFHLPHGARRGDGIEFAAGATRMTLRLPDELQEVRLITASDDGTLGWAAPRYGELEPITTVVAEGRLRLPWRGASTFRVRP